MQSKPVSEVYAYCPRCGSSRSADTVGEIPFKCNACGFSNYFGPVAAVGGIVVNEQGAMLFIRRARNPGKGKWGLPGGFVDAGETGEQAVIREVAEETGLEVTSSSYLLTLPNEYDYQGVIAPVIDLFYLTEVVSHDNIKLAEDEVEHFEWSHPTPAHLENMAFQSNRLAIEHWMQLTDD